VSVGNVLRTLEDSGIEGGERFELHATGGEGGAEPLYMITSGAEGSGDEVAMIVLSLEETLEHGTLEADAVLGAVETAVELSGGECELRFHEPTSLLIVRGPEEALALVREVVREAESTAAARRLRD